MKKQDSNKIIEELEIENATLKSDCNIATQAFSDIVDLCFAAINEGMEEKVALRCIIMTSLTAMDWVNHD